ncbi:MAG: isopentenyl-diphosphate Delta-isomerase [Gemmatimonadota bacterium]
MEERVVLVDEADVEIGTAPKLEAHVTGKLHRAISVFLLNSGGEMLLQRRASGKYHSGGLWSNACCSHPRPGERPEDAATRRLGEELGLATALEFAFSFVYRAELEDGLCEHELDHVFVGRIDAMPTPDAVEVEAWRWTAPDDIERELNEDPSRFTAWFPPAFGQLRSRRAFA